MNPAMSPDLPLETTREVRDRCLCLHVQRAARALARRFDAALKPFGLTNGQFSLLMALNRPDGPRISDLAPFLAMDRTTLTAALKVMERRGLVQSAADAGDRRNRRLALTEAGRGAPADRPAPHGPAPPPINAPSAPARWPVRACCASRRP